MFEALFSFRGRIGRLRYFLTSLAVSAVCMAGLIVMAVSIWAGRHAGGMAAPVFVFMLLLVAVAVVLIWSGLSLQARRIRDIGWEPLIVIPLWMFLDMADFLAAHAYPFLALPDHLHTLAGALANLALTCALLFVPGRSSDGASAPPSFDAPEPPIAPRPAPQPAMRPAFSPTPSMMGPSGAAPAFGRRGLR